jgi:hypothetical protein
MSRRVSRPAAALLALIIVLSAPSAFAATRSARSRDFTPGIGPRIVRIIKTIAKKFSLTSLEEDFILPTPPKP